MDENMDTDEILEKLKAATGPSPEEPPNPGDLKAWRAKLERSLLGWETLSRTFKSKADHAREKIKAIDILLQHEGATTESVPRQIGFEERVRNLNQQKGARVAAGSPLAASETAFTPVHAYWPAILESLVELGGRAKREDVVDSVGKRLRSILTPADMEILPSGLDVRWRNRVAWQRLNMVNQGLLRSDSQRGIWEITAAGRKWLDDQKNVASALHLYKRLAELCGKSAPDCQVKIAPSHLPGHSRLKVSDAGVDILTPDFDIPVAEWSAKSDDQLWDILESLSNRRIRRPIA